MERLTGATLRLAALVEEMIRGAVRALCDARPELAEEVVDREEAVDLLEVGIEEECLRILALYDPVAGDLRRVAAVLKVNHELERVADLAAGIARRTVALASECPDVPISEHLEEMAALAAEMVRGSIDALIDADAARARAVIALDDEADRLYLGIIDELKRMMRAGEDRLEAGLLLFSAAANLERIADHATNIAEEVVYLKEGVIIRHRDSAPTSTTGRGHAPPRRPAAK
jgi:phosphate transport system protein